MARHAAGGANGDDSAAGVQMGVSLEEREKIVQQAAQDPFAHVEQDPVIRQQVRPSRRQARQAPAQRLSSRCIAAYV